MPQPSALIAIQAFAQYPAGAIITDPVAIAAILAGPYAGDVQAISFGQAPAEILTLAVTGALANAPLVLSGMVTGGSPAALDYTIDNGVTWAPVGNYLLSGGNWAGTGPIYATRQTGFIAVRDHAQPDVLSPVAGFSVTVPGGGGGSINGTLTLADGSMIDGIGAGLQAGGNGAAPGVLAVLFGEVAGRVADGGALAGEIAARLQGESANAAAAAAAQAAADAAIPGAQKGQPAGIAPLDGASLVPLANLPSPAGQSWTDIAANAGIFRHAPVPAPPAALPGLRLADRFKIAGELNFAEIWGPQENYDAWPALQNFLLYAQLLALSMKTSSIDNLTQRSCIRVILPRGAYLVSQPLIVPEFVELDCRGTIFRAAYTGDQSNNGTTSVPGIFATNQFLPTAVIPPRGHARALNIYVNTDGNINHRGSGVAIGKNWAAQNGATCVVGAPGAGYSVGDKLFMAQPSVGGYFGWGAQVASVDASGAILSATVFATGAYSLPPATYNGGPSLQQQQWSAANGFSVFDPSHPGCFLVHSAYQSDGVTPTTGTGATLAPVWQPDYVSGVAAYSIGAAIVADTQVGKINITGGVPAIIDGIHGGTFSVMVTGLNAVIDEIEVLGGNAGVLCYFANDVRLGIVNVVEAGVGMQVYGSGSIACPNLVFDTCGAALLIDESQGVYLRGRAFFEQGNIGVSNAYPNSLGNAIKIGAASSVTFPNSDIHIDLGLVNMGGLPQTTISAHPGTFVGSQTPRPMAASVFLSWLFGSRIDIKVTNFGEQGGQPSILPTSGFCQFGFGVDAGNDIRGSIDTVPVIDGVAPPSQIITSTAGHAFPGCAIRVWDGFHGGWCGPFDVYELFGTAAPVNGTTGTGAGFAAPGSVFVDTASGAGRRYVNTGTVTAPVWS